MIRHALLLLVVCATSSAHATTMDLLRIPPEGHGIRSNLTIDLVDITVHGAAMSTVRKDTLDVVLTGRPTRIEFRLPTAGGDVLDFVELTMIASEIAWVQPMIARGGREAPSGAPIAIGEAARVRIELHDRVMKAPQGGLAHLVLSLPPIVGRVKLVAPIEFGGSAAPRRIARLQDVVTECRTLAPERAVSWKLRVPERARLRMDLAHGARSHPNETLTLVTSIRDRRGGVRLHEFPVVPAPGVAQAQPWSSLDLDLESYAGREITLEMRMQSSRPDVRSSRLVLASPRIVTTDEDAPAVLVIVVDTLTDHDPWTTSKDARPRMTRLAAESIDFRRAYANSSWTLPSTGSLLSSRLPSRHGLGHGSASTTQLHPQFPTFAEALRGAGWSTGAVSANPIVSPGTGLERGFDHFDQRPSRDPHTRAAEVTVDAALEWLRGRRGERWMLYAHFFDPHDRYQAPDPWRMQFVAPDRGAEDHTAEIWSGSPNGLRDAILDGGPAFEVPQKDVELLVELYRGEVAYVDAMIGALLDSLQSWGELERAAVVLTSDHGEEFLEHDMLKHGHALHEELIAVPLTFRLPGHSPAIFETPVSLLDVAPTLTARLGIEFDPGDGRDLLARWPQPPPAAPVIAELVSRVEHEGWAGEWSSILDDVWKWVRTPRSELLFRLDLDPAEAHDLTAEHPEVAERLRALADAMQEDHRPLVAPVAEDPRRIELLRSLGYIR